ncbi:Gfo/Idh/MocA family oxidoreductase [Brevibacillus humidisoli]|uniref:Gfo/Idh/MocA family protein n=1 Tax=Brevibacillus humidisoli TaxID=2895522 RepID=UPI001E38EC45|nr:Gfo/Idh/MocA family oxidoreductase [Brevibacillus humidisoli]UFJ40818.1 Gfo/Idh/MocA family oxidoreductase [Brevibacillus humidisoli]
MTIHVAIIGCGSIAEFRHAPEYANNPHVTIAAFYDRNRERAEQLANRYGGRVVDDYREIMEDKTIDAISDCSSNETHHVISTLALQHGKHVLCEKPLAITLEHAAEIIRAQKESGKILMVGHNQRLSKAHQKAKQILQSGELGKVLSFQTNFGHRGPEHWSATKGSTTWFFDKQRSVLGVAGDLGIHKVDLIRYLLDDEFAEVTALQGVLDKKDGQGNPIAVCDNMVCLFRMTSGTMGTASFSWTYYGEEDNSTILYCQHGEMRIYADPTYPLEIVKPNGERIRYQLAAMQTNDNQTNSGVIDAFVDSIVMGAAPPISGEDGLIALRVVWAALESAERGIKLRIDPPAY